MYEPLPKIDQFALLNIEGSASIEFVNRLFSRKLSALKLDEACLSLLLSAEGRVQNLFWCLRRTSGLDLLCREPESHRLQKLLQNYHFGEEICFHPPKLISAFWVAKGQEEDLLKEGAGLIVADGTKLKALWKKSLFEFDLKGTKPSSSEPEDSDQWEEYRIQHLIPRLDYDYNTRTLAFDLGFESLCDSEKGCYVGQEIIERVRSRGKKINKCLCALQFPGKVLPEEELVHPNQQDQRLGQLTKSVLKQRNGNYLALGYLKSSHLSKKIPVKAAGSGLISLEIRQN